MSRNRSIFSLIAVSGAALIAAVFIVLRRPQKTVQAPPPTIDLIPITIEKPSLPPTAPAQTIVVNPPQAASQPNRFLYVSGGLFFTIVSVLLSQSGVLSPLLVLCWLMSIALVGSVLGANWKALLLEIPTSLKKTVLSHGLEILAVIAFTAIGAWMQLSTHAPSTPVPETARVVRTDGGEDINIPLAIGGDGVAPVYNDGSLGVGFYALEKLFTHHDLAGLQSLSGLFAILIIPAAYLLGRAVNGTMTGLFASGFAAVSGWTLALGKSGQVYPALAVFGALLLAALLQAQRTHQRSAYLLAGIIFGVGWLFSPLFVYMALLLPTMIVLDWLSNAIPFLRQQGVASYRFAGWQSLSSRLRDGVATALIALVIILPFVLAPHFSAPPSAVTYDTGLSPATTFTDALSSSLLMLVVSSDPSPLHGIINRPVLSPLLAALFLIGLLAWLFSRQKSVDKWLIIIALMFALLPSAMVIDPPPRYPDLQRAAAALPVALVIAAYGLAFFARLIIAKHGNIRRIIVSEIFLIALLLIGSDAYRHYITAVLPAFH